MTNKKYLYVKGCAGLGNRLVTVYSALQYCKKNNRSIVIDWTDGQFDKKGINAFEKCFEMRVANETKIEAIPNWEQLTHSSVLFKKNKGEGVYDLYLDTQSTLWKKFPMKLFFLESSRKLRRRWQPIKNGSFSNSLNFGSDLKDNRTEDVLYYVDSLPYLDYSELPNSIKLKSAVAEKINEFARQNNISKAVGVHVRNTDKRPTKEVIRVIDHIKAMHSTASVFLSTDSIEAEDLFAKNISNLILFPKQKPQLNGEGMHQWALYNNKDDQKYMLYEECVIEMYLLSKCNYLYYQGNSTFSSISNVHHNNKNNCYNWLKLQ